MPFIKLTNSFSPIKQELTIITFFNVQFAKKKLEKGEIVPSFCISPRRVIVESKV